MKALAEMCFKISKPIIFAKARRMEPAVRLRPQPSIVKPMPHPKYRHWVKGTHWRRASRLLPHHKPRGYKLCGCEEFIEEKPTKHDSDGMVIAWAAISLAVKEWPRCTECALPILPCIKERLCFNCRKEFKDLIEMERLERLIARIFGDPDPFS